MLQFAIKKKNQKGALLFQIYRNRFQHCHWSPPKPTTPPFPVGIDISSCLLKPSTLPSAKMPQYTPEESNTKGSRTSRGVETKQLKITSKRIQ